MSEDPREKQVGLCLRCAHARVQKSAKGKGEGSEYWRCARADSDEGFLRYPPLPVTSCAGFEPS